MERKIHINTLEHPILVRSPLSHINTGHCRQLECGSGNFLLLPDFQPFIWNISCNSVFQPDMTFPGRARYDCCILVNGAFNRSLMLHRIVCQAHGRAVGWTLKPEDDELGQIQKWKRKRSAGRTKMANIWGGCGWSLSDYILSKRILRITI